MSISNIEVTFSWDKDTYIKGSKSLYNDLLKHSPRRFFGWIFIAMSQFGLVAFFKKGAFGLLFLSTILLIYWYILRWPIRKMLLLNSFKKSPIKDKVFTVVIKKSGIMINDIDILWKEVNRILIEDEGFLLYYHDNFIYIPKDAFKDDDYEKAKKIFKKQSTLNS